MLTLTIDGIDTALENEIGEKAREEYSRYIRQKLAEAETAAASPDAVWVGEDAFFADDETA
jgi:hypothetical protein